jgi:hypothetical protein
MSQVLTPDDPVQNLAVPFLTVIPAASYLFPWTFVTAAFVEENIFSVPFSRLNRVDK